MADILNGMSFLDLTFGTGCRLGELRVNLWLGGPGKILPFQNTATALQVQLAK